MHVSIIDSSVLCNILNIPNMNSHVNEITEELKKLTQDPNHSLILPLAAIIETGNHIAHIADGRVRRERARLMSTLIQKTINNETPWTYYGRELSREELMDLSADFEDYAASGIGIGDVSIIQVYKKIRDTFPAIGSIRIWSLDRHLAGFSEVIAMSPRRRNR